jgi:hypothetical protein
MGIALHWWDGRFYCELTEAGENSTLRMFADGELLHQQQVGSIAAAYRCAREVSAALLQPRRKEGQR